MTNTKLRRSQIYVIGTIVVLAILGAFYLLIVVPSNEKTLVERRYRVLQNIVDNAEDKLENGDSLLARLVLPINSEKRPRFIEVQNQKESFLIHQSGQFPPDDRYLTNFTFDIDSSARKLTLALKVNFQSKGARPDSGSLSIAYSSRQFLGRLLPDQIFDEYLVYNKNAVLYESFGSQLSPELADSILTLKPKLTTASVPLITLYGNKYRAFLQGFTLGGNTSLTVVGLLKQQKFQDQRMELPTGILMILLTIVLIIIIAFPWIKLYQMGSKDRLTTTDTVATVVGLMLLMGLIFFVSYRYCRNSMREAKAGSLDNLSATLLSNFKTERDSCYELIKFLDAAEVMTAAMADPGRATADTTKRKKSSAPAPVKDDLVNARNLLVDSDFIRVPVLKLDSTRIDQVFWLDSSGKEIQNWTTRKDKPLNGNYKNRNYFKRAVKGSAYRLNEDLDKPYFLDQIVSWADGSFTSVISIPSNRRVDGHASRVAAMTFAFTSLAGAILPAGYEFAMVDSAGKVLYHSIESKNLNENLLSEFSEGTKLGGALRARSEGYFTTKYLDGTYRVKITPVPDLPYSLVVLENTDYEDAIDVEVYSFTFIMFFMVVAFTVLLSLVSLLLSSRKSLFRKQSFDVIRFAPKRSEAWIYNTCALFGLWLIVLLIVLFKDSYILEFFFLIPIAIIMQSLFYNALLYSREIREKKEHSHARRFSLGWYSLILCLLIFLALSVLCISHWGRVGLFLLFGPAGAALFAAARFISKSRRKLLLIVRRQERYYLESFAVMLTIRMVITCGIPVVFFYLSSLLFHNALSSRDRFLQQSQKMYFISPGNPSVYIDSNYTNSFLADSNNTARKSAVEDSSSGSNPDHNGDCREDELIVNLFSSFRLGLTEASRHAAGLTRIENVRNSFYFNQLPLKLSQTGSVQLSFPNINKYGRARLTSGLIGYQPMRFGSNSSTSIFVYALILILLFAFAFIARQTIRKLFALNLPDLKKLNNLDKEILIDNSVNNLLFVIGLPGAGKLDYIKKLLAEQKLQGKNAETLQLPGAGERGNVFIADLINIPDSLEVSREQTNWTKYLNKIFDPGNKLVILNHFEYNMQVDVTSRIKLNLLEELMLRNQCKIIVLSTVHPVAFLDSINAHHNNSKVQSSTTHDLERWHVLLGHYRMIILPIHSEKPKPGKTVASADDTMVAELIRRETASTHFIHNMKNAVSKVVQQPGNRPTGQLQDELSFKLQITSHYFYMYIWQSLTKEEKYLLYDLAEDKLINSYDTYNLSLLIAKGVIVDSDGLLAFFNRGFRNFILTAIGHAEASKIQNRLADTGNWNNLRLPMILVLGAILSFLFFSQQEAYSELIAYIAALSAGIPAVLKIFSLFEQKFHKEAT